jgi:antitoxin MazE
MKSRIVRIGNSQGIRIPKPLLKQTGLAEEVEIQVQHNRLIITPAGRPRAGWSAGFREMARKGDDILLAGETHLPTLWEGDQWEW